MRRVAWAGAWAGWRGTELAHKTFSNRAIALPSRAVNGIADQIEPPTVIALIEVRFSWVAVRGNRLS